MGLIKYIGKMIDKIDVAYAKAIDEGGPVYQQVLAQLMLAHGEAVELAIQPIYLPPEEPMLEPEPIKIAGGIEEILQEG